MFRAALKDSLKVACVIKDVIPKRFLRDVPICTYHWRSSFAFMKIFLENITITPTHNYSNVNVPIKEIDRNLFEKVCEETLESLAEFFEDLVGKEQALFNADVNYSSGVLTVDLMRHGVYVINRQSPNKQIWLSSPISGPKRYDYLIKQDCWIYRHDSVTLHKLLEQELTSILGKYVNLSSCWHYKTS